MTPQSKKKILVFFGMAVLLTILLASSLSQVTFKPGQPLPSYSGGHLHVQESVGVEPSSLHINTFFITLVGAAVAIYLVVVLWQLVMGSNWKKVLVAVLKFGMDMLAFTAILLLLLMVVLGGQPVDEPEMPLPAPTEPPVFVPLGSPPASLIRLVGIGLAVLAAAMLISWQNMRRKPDRMSLLEQEAETARQNILAGLGFKETILRCYQQMGLVLRQEGGLEREAFMTPAEFERLLAAEGLPRTPVHQLTHLFEVVRYGDWSPKPEDTQTALESLDELIHYLRSKKTGGGSDA